MWTHRDEEWYQKRKRECKAAGEIGQAAEGAGDGQGGQDVEGAEESQGGENGQPKSQRNWKRQSTNRHKLDVPFEE